MKINIINNDDYYFLSMIMPFRGSIISFIISTRTYVMLSQSLTFLSYAGLPTIKSTQRYSSSLTSNIRVPSSYLLFQF